MRTDHLDRPLPAHRRGTLSGMDAAPELTRTYLQRVPRWWRARTLQPSCRPAASGLCRWRMARHVRCRASSLASCAADDARIRRRDWIIPPPGLLIPSLRGL
ncbi:hypothetical protein F7R02_11625 [Xanthomonas cissicola]|nr:hypothetical protein F7R02_11625 [Xanthomonas cissicola]